MSFTSIMSVKMIESVIQSLISQSSVKQFGPNKQENGTFLSPLHPFGGCSLLLSWFPCPNHPYLKLRQPFIPKLYSSSDENGSSTVDNTAPQTQEEKANDVGNFGRK
jgi:hypothetical protein